MRYVAVMLLVAAKLAALGLLPILVLGYLFFLSSQSLLTHLYVAATFLGLVLTIAATARALQSVMWRTVHGVIALAATALGCLKVHEHLMFFEGPAYGVAGMTAIGVLAILVGFLGGGYLVNAEGEGTDV